MLDDLSVKQPTKLLKFDFELQFWSITSFPLYVTQSIIKSLEVISPEVMSPWDLSHVTQIFRNLVRWVLGCD